MEREKVDKAALGYDYKGETEKHQSQKGGETLGVGSSGLWSDSYRMCVCVQIIHRALEAVMVYRPTAWTRLV